MNEAEEMERIEQLAFELARARSIVRAQADELAAAGRRIRELEEQLCAGRKASDE